MFYKNNIYAGQLPEKLIDSKPQTAVTCLVCQFEVTSVSFIQIIIDK